MLKWIRVAAAAACVVLVAGCSNGHDEEPTVVGVALNDPQFSLLAEAVTTAGLAETLNGPGPFTVFAPTNAAFTSLLGELGVTKEALFANKPLLTTVLTYHVLAGDVSRAQIMLGKAVTTVQGGIFKVDAGTGPSGLVITDGRNRTSRIVSTDTRARNGVVHAIDRVLLPADKNLVQTAQANPSFSLLVEAVVAAGLADALSAPGPLTVFAPTNDAFVALLAELGTTKEALFADTALLRKVLTYHVVSGRVLRADVPVGSPITTLGGDTFTVTASPSLGINDQNGRRAGIVATDVLTSNGVIHVLDKVLLPRL